MCIGCLALKNTQTGENSAQEEKKYIELETRTQSKEDAAGKNKGKYY